MNDDNSATLNFELPQHRLYGESFFIKVTLRGVNVDPLSQTFVMTNDPSGIAVVQYTE